MVSGTQPESTRCVTLLATPSPSLDPALLQQYKGVRGRETQTVVSGTEESFVQRPSIGKTTQFYIDLLNVRRVIKLLVFYL